MAKPNIQEVCSVLALILGVVGSVWAGETAPELRRRAERGDAGAQYALGFWHETGARRDLPRDHAAAAKWFLKAAQQGHANAQISLGNQYKDGRGVPRDYVQAHSWLDLGASQSTGRDRRRAADARKWLAKQMPPAQLAEAQRLVREWKRARGEDVAAPAMSARLERTKAKLEH